MTEQYLTLAIVIGQGAQGHRQTAQRFTNAKVVSAVAQAALAIHLWQLQAGGILNRRQAFGKPNGTKTIAASRGVQAQRLVRALQIIAVRKAVELALAMLEAGEVEVAQ